jgi:hypothetical protein
MQDQRKQFRINQCNRTLDVLVQIKNCLNEVYDPGSICYCEMKSLKEKLFFEEAFSTEDSPTIVG